MTATRTRAEASADEWKQASAFARQTSFRIVYGGGSVKSVFLDLDRRLLEMPRSYVFTVLHELSQTLSLMRYDNSYTWEFKPDFSRFNDAVTELSKRHAPMLRTVIESAKT